MTLESEYLRQFFKTISSEEFEETLRRGYLNKDQVMRLWRMHNLQSEQPETLPLVLTVPKEDEQYASNCLAAIGADTLEIETTDRIYNQ
jgi:hypothetical protein